MQKSQILKNWSKSNGAEVMSDGIGFQNSLAEQFGRTVTIILVDSGGSTISYHNSTATDIHESISCLLICTLQYADYTEIQKTNTVRLHRKHYYKNRKKY